MRKTWKKATAITLAGVTAMSMAACGGSSDKKESTSSTTEDGKPVISMMVPAFYGTELQNEHSDEVIKKYEDYTGVSVEWKFENDGTYKIIDTKGIQTDVFKLKMKLFKEKYPGLYITVI